MDIHVTYLILLLAFIPADSWSIGSDFEQKSTDTESFLSQYIQISQLKKFVFIRMVIQFLSNTKPN